MTLRFPFGLSDLNLLLATLALTLLVTQALLVPLHGKTTARINSRRLRNVTWLVVISFAAVMTISIINIMNS